MRIKVRDQDGEDTDERKLRFRRASVFLVGWAGEEQPAKLVRRAAEAIDSLARQIAEGIAPRDEAVAP